MAAAESSAVAGIRKAPSMEWRWVSTEEDDDDGKDGGGGAAAVGAVGRGGSFESEEEEDAAENDDDDEGKQRLIRTMPSVDWFDVEGNEVSVAPQLENSEVRGQDGCLIASRARVSVARSGWTLCVLSIVFKTIR
jgi:KUP system potassium uptake protein